MIKFHDIKIGDFVMGEFEGQKTVHFARLRRPALISVAFGLLAAAAATAPFAHAERRVASGDPSDDGRLLAIVDIAVRLDVRAAHREHACVEGHAID